MVRFKNRYMLFHIHWKDAKIDETINEAALAGAVRDSIAENFGDHGAGTCATSLQVKCYNPYTRLCVVRCSKEQHQQVWCSISMLTTIRRRTVACQLIHLSGTVQSCRAKAVEYNKILMAQTHLGPKQQVAAEQAAAKLAALEI